MDHLAQDLSVALEESESCGPVAFEGGRKWGMRRRTRSAGNLRTFRRRRLIRRHCTCHVPDLYGKAGDNQSDDSSSSNSEARPAERNNSRRLASFHQSDSDDMSLGLVVRAMGNRNSLRMKHPFQTFLRGRYNRLGRTNLTVFSPTYLDPNIPGMSYSLESDSLNEHSPARPSLRRKRKLKRVSMDETPIPPCGKRKRAQRMEDNCRSLRGNQPIKPLHQSIVDKIEKFCQHNQEAEDVSIGNCKNGVMLFFTTFE